MQFKLHFFTVSLLCVNCVTFNDISSKHAFSWRFPSADLLQASEDTSAFDILCFSIFHEYAYPIYAFFTIRVWIFRQLKTRAHVKNSSGFNFP